MQLVTTTGDQSAVDIASQQAPSWQQGQVIWTTVIRLAKIV
jgi:hypothetical protein